jgi:hypothetical protein
MALPKAFYPDQANCNPLRDGLQTPLRCCRRDQDISAAAPKRTSRMLFRFLGSAGAPFLRPGLHDTRAPRGAAVKTGRRPSPEAARSGLDGCEHGARLDQVGSYLSCRVMVPTSLQPSAARKRCLGCRAMLDGSGKCTPPQGIRGVSKPSSSALTAGRKFHLYNALMGLRLQARGFAAQQTEATIGVAVLHRIGHCLAVRGWGHLNFHPPNAPTPCEMLVHLERGDLALAKHLPQPVVSHDTKIPIQGSADALAHTGEC